MGIDGELRVTAAADTLSVARRKRYKEAVARAARGDPRAKRVGVERPRVAAAADASNAIQRKQYKEAVVRAPGVGVERPRVAAAADASKSNLDARLRQASAPAVVHHNRLNVAAAGDGVTQP